MWTPGGSVFGVRPPSEVRPSWKKLPPPLRSNADLLSLEAMADEQQLDFAAAETIGKNMPKPISDRSVGFSSLADFYGRRLRPSIRSPHSMRSPSNLPMPKSGC